MRQGCSIYVTAASSTAIVQGGGVWLNSGSLSVSNCQFRQNTLYHGNPVYTMKVNRQQGGAIAGADADVTLYASSFSNNYAYGRGSAYGPTIRTYGGAIYLEDGSADLDGVIFSGNYVNATANDGKTREGYGGACHFIGTTPAVMNACTLVGNQAKSQGHPSLGMAVYAAGGANVTLAYSDVRGNTSTEASQAVYGATTLTLRNCLVTANTGDGIGRGSGTLKVLGCTLAGNTGWGFVNAAGDAVSVTNCIAWGNSSGGFSGPVNVGYTCSQEVLAGPGTLNTDPLFADASGGDYHLQSSAGRWDPEIAGWVTDAETSPCVDAGHPDDLHLDEPAPNGKRRNMGAYGGTAYASKTPILGTVFLIR